MLPITFSQKLEDLGKTATSREQTNAILTSASNFHLDFYFIFAENRLLIIGQHVLPHFQSPDLYVFHFPCDLQHKIFQTAAILDGRVALALSLVSREVRSCVEPYMYKRVVLRHTRAATCFLQLIRSKPRGHFSPLIKSLAFGRDVSHQLARIILADCSRHLIHFTCFSHNNNATNPFPGYIRSSNLRSLTLIFTRDVHHDAFHRAPYDLLPQTLSLLTHLAIVIDYNHSAWSGLTSAIAGFRDPHEELYKSRLAAFENLTHFAVSCRRLRSSIGILQVAPRLQYFAVLEMQNYRRDERAELVKFARSQGNRSLVFMKDLGSPRAWSIDNEFCPVVASFWEKVEYLVQQEYISDIGERW